MGVVRINIPAKNPLPDLWERVAPDFVKDEPRPYQAEVLSVIRFVLDNDHFDNIIVQAPTGIGKSAIAMTVQSWFESGYILTPTLGLTQQYRDDYSHMIAEVRGRSNFECWVRDGTAADAPCQRSRKKRCQYISRDDPCPYYEQKYDAIDHRMTLSNPAYLFRVIQGHGEDFKQRDIAIIDEAHNLESFFMGLLEIPITEMDWRAAFGEDQELPIHYHVEDWIDDVQALHQAATNELMAIDPDEDSPIAVNARKRWSGVVSRTSTLIELMIDPNNITLQTERGRTVFKPIRVSPWVPEYLTSVAQTRIMLSATILDIDTFTSNLGIQDQHNLYLNITQSPFPKENLSIVYAPCGPMSYGKRKHTIPKQVNAISAIMNRFDDKRGVILPHSHAIRQEIVEGLIASGHGERVLTHGSNAYERQQVLDEFFRRTDEPLVLVSTYVGEGFDFKGNLAEWLVICKIPYLYTPDPQIALRMEQDEHRWRAMHEGTEKCPYEKPSPYSNGLCGSWTCHKPCQSWYRLQTSLRLVQGAGRVVRTPTDVGHVFILDRGWDRYLKQNGGLLPSWFRRAITNPPTWLRRHLP